ncbi:uncharacterized protein LOC111282055 isoform X2 [Durio zibethinus]|uniref:Uncharacterized protein LOC111282055 isoform X2 n=1 Tax=Durio zibethinus TaxID=66656 RepID=A0A6P5XCW6_DURZI|nr:uncharacterized protein LOC111282055 isoform X2 [Durio zibethinus]
MRYQRVSPDCHPPLSSAKKFGLKPTITTTAAATMCREESGSCSNSCNIENGGSVPKDIGTAFEGAKGVRYRSPSRSQDHLQNGTSFHPRSGVSGNGIPNSLPKAQAQTEGNNLLHDTPKRSKTTSPKRCDVLLQWGQKKRARVSRSEIRPLAGDSSSSSVPGKQHIGNKVHRRVLHATMPPPPPPPPAFNTARCSNLRNGLLSSRNLDERSAAASGSPSRNSGGTSRAASRSMAGKQSPTLETLDRKKLCAGSVKDEKKKGPVVQTDRLNQTDSAPVQSEQAGGAANTVLAAGVGEKVNVEVIEWPRIYVALSRKEKEDDFLAMKGTKLPQRPKKRAKNVDRTLQYCFPGMWLSDLTKSRYEVREKKSVKKLKRRGLKGMEREDSDSE